MKKFLVTLLTCILALGMLCGCGELPSGQFYTMEEAYENGWITREDIMEVCYRSFGEVKELTIPQEQAENFGFDEEDVQIVDYVSPYPEPVLDKKTEKAIIHAYYIETNGAEHGYSESKNYTFVFYGKFNDFYIVNVRCIAPDCTYSLGWRHKSVAGIAWLEGEGWNFQVFRFDE